MSVEGGVNYSLLLKPQIDTGVKVEFMASGRGLFGFSSCSWTARVEIQSPFLQQMPFSCLSTVTVKYLET